MYFNLVKAVSQDDVADGCYITGEVTKHEDAKCILNEGMPFYKNPLEKGRLVVFFHVKFPEDGWIPKEKIIDLKKYLPTVQEPMIPDHAEECMLLKFDPNTDKIGANGMRRGEAYDSDDEGSGPHGGAQRVQCASQ